MGAVAYPQGFFVPLDTMPNTKYMSDLSSQERHNQYVVLRGQNRKAIKKQYKNDDQFVNGFQVTDSMLKEITDRGEADGVKFNQEEFDRSRGILSAIVKGLIGRDIYESQTYDKVYNPYDPIFREALRIIEGEEYDSLLK